MTTPQTPEAAVQDRNEAFQQGAVNNSAGLDQQREQYDRNAVRQFAPDSVLHQIVASPNGLWDGRRQQAIAGQRSAPDLQWYGERHLPGAQAISPHGQELFRRESISEYPRRWREAENSVIPHGCKASRRPFVDYSWSLTDVPARGGTEAVSLTA
jgi:hypothetical protein